MSSQSVGVQMSNGFLLTIQHFCAKEYGWDLQQINNTSLISIMLLLRQHLTSEGQCAFSLEEQEMLENGKSWE